MAGPGFHGTVASAPSFCVHAAKRDRAYAPSYDWGTPTLGARHERIADAVWSIPGWLSVADTMKLYELAYFSSGTVLEIGTYCGRSTVAMAIGLADSGSRHCVVSLDIDAPALVLAQRSARAHEVADRVVLVGNPLDSLLRAVPLFAPSVVFVDGDHSAAGVAADIESLAQCVRPGTLLLFHDYLPSELPDTEGFPVAAGSIDVAETVAASWVPQCSDFAGTFGWSALYRVRRPPLRAPNEPGRRTGDGHFDSTFIQ